jgi:cyclase
MQEISSHIYIETAYAGVTLGAINWPHGLILIDSPLRAEDTRAWRSALLNLGGGVDRMLINLDAHFDRTLGTRGMECTVLGHEKLAEVFHNRPINFKAQATETGAEWEQYSSQGSIRWVPPEITFSDKMMIHWDDHSLVLETHLGPAAGAIWVEMPNEKIAFIGDAVMVNQPPFLGGASIPAWIASLEQLLSLEYREYLLVSGRGGLVAQQQVRDQIDFLRLVEEQVGGVAKKNATPEDAAALAPGLLKNFNLPAGRELQYEQRLRYGLNHYFVRHFRPSTVVIEE